MNFFNKKQSGLFVVILFFMTFATSFLHVSNVDINSKVCGTIISRQYTSKDTFLANVKVGDTLYKGTGPTKVLTDALANNSQLCINQKKTYNVVLFGIATAILGLLTLISGIFLLIFLFANEDEL